MLLYIMIEAAFLNLHHADHSLDLLLNHTDRYCIQYEPYVENGRVYFICHVLLGQDPQNSDRNRIDWNAHSVFRFDFSNAD